MLPPGVSLGRYLSFASAALISMFLGAQLVHNYYKPMKDLNRFIEAEVNKLPEHQKEKLIVELHLKERRINN